jgi:hypothetical protein
MATRRALCFSEYSVNTGVRRLWKGSVKCAACHLAGTVHTEPMSLSRAADRREAEAGNQKVEKAKQ